MELVEIINNLFTYGHGQNNTVYDILGKGWRLTEPIKEDKGYVCLCFAS